MATAIFTSPDGKGIMAVGGTGLIVDTPVVTGITIQTPTFSPTDPKFTPGTSGQVVATLSARPAGATRSITPNDGRFALSADGTQVLEGGSSSTPGSLINVAVTDTHPDATNSPQSVTFSIEVLSGATGSAFSAPVQVTGNNAPAGTVMTFGQAFVRGHLAPGQPLSLRRSNGTLLATQYDNVSNLWDDGTIQFAVVHVREPGWINGQIDAATLVPEAGPSAGANINLASALAGHTVKVEIKNGGSVFLLDVVANLPTARWWSGPLASSARVEAAVPRGAVGGSTDATLIADVIFTADGVVECDVTLWNRNTFEPSQGSATFDMRIIGGPDGGITKASKSSVSVRLYCGYPLRSRWVKATGAAAPNRAFPWQSTNYMMRTGWVAHWDQGLTYNESMFTGWATSMASAGWNDPLATRGIRTDMGGGGGSDIVGALMKSSAAWIASGRQIAAQFAMDQSDAANQIPWYHWSRSSNAWVNPIDHPTRRIRSGLDNQVPSGGTAYTTSAALNNPFQMDTAHWPSISFIPYLLTGRRVCLDRCMGQACFGIMYRWQAYERRTPANTADTPEGRAARKASIPLDGRGVNLFDGGVQVRDGAWSMRCVIDAMIAPASQQPHGDFFRRALTGNFAWLDAQKPSMLSSQGQFYGVTPGWSYGNPTSGAGAPWQFDFQVTQFVRAARLLIPKALDWMVWSQNYHIGRFLANAQGFNPADGVQYNIRYGPGPNGPPPWNTTWAQLQTSAEFTHGVNFSREPVLKNINDYARFAQSSVNQVCDLFVDFGQDATKALAAKAFLDNAPPVKTNTSVDSYRADPQTSVTRRGVTRGP